MTTRPTEGQSGRPLSRNTLIHFLFLILFAFALLFNIWRAPFGYFTRDESLYLAIPYRMLQGDVLLLHEWHLSQTSAFLLLPLVKLYLSVFGSTDGIALFFRYVYIFFHSLVALYIYVRTSKLRAPGSRIAALIAAVVYELYCYHAIIALSYNSMGIGLMIVAVLTAAGCRRPWEMGLAGFALAGAVLCSPYLVSLYLLYSAAVFVPKLRPSSPEAEIAFSRRAWLLASAACLLSALAFLSPVLLSGQASLVPVTIRQILNDTQHPKRSLPQLAARYVSSFYRYNGHGRLVLYGGGVLSAVILLDRRRSVRRPLYLAAAVVFAVFFSLTYLLMYYHDEGFVFGFILIGFFAWLTAEKRNRPLFAMIYVPALLYSFCTYSSSNLELICIMSAMTVALPAAALFTVSAVLDMLRESRACGTVGRWLNRCSCALIALCMLYLAWGVVNERMKDVFFDSPPTELSAVFQEGSSRGLKSTPERVADYDSTWRALAPLREIGDGNVLYLTTESRLYLEDPKGCSSFSMWFWTGDPVEYNAQRLKTYWSLFPWKAPDYIYLDEEQCGSEEYLAAFEAEKFPQMKLERGLVLCLGEK